jgi:polyketide synthase 12
MPPVGPWKLDASNRGTLESLALKPAPEALAPLEPGQVRIAVHAAGLNFRDVMSALGVYPGEAQIGGEGAGLVIEIGPEVTGLSLGDRVLGVMPGAFGPWSVADAGLLVPVPSAWSFEQAAALPVTHLTAWFGLNDLADLQPGERVLIHAGAGGVGMAAIQFALHRGAEVFATASPSKWEALRELGVAADRIASSRDLEFRECFLEQTGGEGVDVVLNALAGEFVDASLDLLPRGGRFLEMGKTDVREPEQVAAAHPGVEYRAFDLFEAGPERTGEMLAEIAAMVGRGELDPPPITAWEVRQAPEAFRHLREGRNVGKVVLTIPQPIDPQRTVLISGGTGVLAGLVARHMVERHGAHRLLLASRSGPEAAGAAELAAELEALGAAVRIEACDVSERAQLERLLASIDPEYPLGAVVHAAGALADGVIESMGPEQIERAFAPKLDAAWHLHELTRELDLSAFVLFSSIGGTLGGPGQANYAAANAFLDALAAHRNASGLPATSIAWGLWERESGMTGHLGEADRERMRRRGFGALADEQALALFDAALISPDSPALAMRIEADGLRALAGAGVLPPILSGLVGRRAERRLATVSLAAKLAALPEEEHEAAVLELVRAEAAAVLGHSAAEEVPLERPFKELGFDSLAAVELRNRLNTATGQRLSATVVFDYPSVAALAEHVLAGVKPDGKSEQALESGEREIREALASLPLARLRSAGLIDPLLRLAGGEADPAPEPEEKDGDRIDAMNVEELLQASQEGAP